MSDHKRCAKCGEVKPCGEFPPGKKWKDGLFPYCRECKRAVQRADHAKHAVERSLKNKARYAADPEPWKARRKKRYYADPARAAAEASQWNRANPEKRRVTEKKWRDANMQGLVREAVRRRYATRKGATSIRFSPDQLAQRAAYYGYQCWMCGDPMAAWDHVKPLSKGGWHCLSNLRPACKPCNSRKSDRWPLTKGTDHVNG